MSEELKPCPFCWGKNIAVRITEEGREVACKDCGSRGPERLHVHGPATAPATTAAAIAAWNRRAWEEDTEALKRAKAVVDHYTRTGFCYDKDVLYFCQALLSSPQEVRREALVNADLIVAGNPDPVIEALRRARLYIKRSKDDSGHRKWALAGIDAALLSPTDARREGMAVVPVEPTPEMMMAGLRSMTVSTVHNGYADRIWSAMLAASPYGKAPMQEASAERSGANSNPQQEKDA